MTSKGLLILGKTPPPIGGVTIHVQRLVECVNRDGLSADFKTLDLKSLSTTMTAVARSKMVHLHTSNVYLRLFLAVWARLVSTVFIFTLHGNLGRYGKVGNAMDEMTIRLAKVPVVINTGSYNRALELNKNTRLLSAFIPPVGITPLPKELNDRVQHFVQKYDKCYCTNAFNLTFDRDGNEIYGISHLITFFQGQPNLGLIFSDPSGNYTEYLKDSGVDVSSNVMIIPFPHDAINILKLSDVFLRTTTTDGDSLSVREALYYGKGVVASDCVGRPDGCTLYETSNFEDMGNKILNTRHADAKVSHENGYDQLRLLYEEIASENKIKMF